MKIQLIQGQFSSKDAIDILTQIIHVKIKFQEGKIAQHANEEDVKMREKRIKELQHDLYKARKHIESQNASISITGEIEVGE